MEISERYLLSFRAALRINHHKFDDEISDLIAAARFDLCVLGGIKPEKVRDETDPLIKRAIDAYVKSEFGLDNGDAEKYRNSYEALKTHLMMSDDYKERIESG
jgi:uncharacterized phage protein (predicted DNA packaging)